MHQKSFLESAIRYEGGLTRRLWLAYGASLAAIPFIQPQGVYAKPTFAADPFQLGVASGDPTDTGVVLWTKLAPKPLDPDGGMKPENYEVTWEISTDDQLKTIIQTGTSTAMPQLAHSIHVEVDNLKPDRWYWYRFKVGDAVSPIGRTRTMPDKSTTPAQMKFAFASCQHYEQGLFTAYGHMAKDNPDMVIHLGDYIYEYAGKDKLVRKHAGPKIYTLADYRIRHNQYRADPLLHRMHAQCPWVVTWDDHEFENNYANDIPEKKVIIKKGPDGEILETKEISTADFLKHRANAYQAYYEMMPLRKVSVPQGPNMKIYRTINFGRLASFHVLDTRQYRSDQPNNDKASPLNDAALNPEQSLLGADQATWLKGALAQSTGMWNVLAQQVMMGLVDFAPAPLSLYSMDQWPGYASERIRLMKYIAERKISNPVVLTGDIHSNWANDLRVDDRDQSTPVVATEFVGTSISSGGNGTKTPTNLEALLKKNPFVKFHNRQRGYVRCIVTPKTWTSDYQIVEEVLKPDGAVSTKASFVVEAGQPGLKQA